MTETERLSLRCSVAEALIESGDDVAVRLLRILCDEGGWDAGELWTVNEAVESLTLAAVWSPSGVLRDALLADAELVRPRLGRGLAGQAWAAAAPRNVLDPMSDPDWRRSDAVRDAGLGSGTAIPLIAAGAVTGIVMLYSHRVRVPGPVELALLATIGATAGEALQRFHGDAELREHALRLRVLADVSLELDEVHPDLHLTFEAAARNTAERMGDLCLVMQLGDDGATFELTAFHHRRADAVLLVAELKDAVAHLLGQTPAGLTLRAGRPLFVPRVTPERIRNLVHEHYWPTIERMRIQSLIVVPLRARGRPVGAILAARDDGGPGYSAEDVVFLQQLAGRVALAVANARECSCALTSLPAGAVTRALAG